MIEPSRSASLSLLRVLMYLQNRSGKITKPPTNARDGQRVAQERGHSRRVTAGARRDENGSEYVEGARLSRQWLTHVGGRLLTRVQTKTTVVIALKTKMKSTFMSNSRGGLLTGS